jgi:hypothetical protein
MGCKMIKGKGNNMGNQGREKCSRNNAKHENE